MSQEPSAPPSSGGGTVVIDIPLPVINPPSIELPIPTVPEVLPGEPPVPAGETAAPVPTVGELVPALPVLIGPEPPRAPSVPTIPTEPPKVMTLPAPTTVVAQATKLVTPVDLGGPPSIADHADPPALGRDLLAGTTSLAADAAPLRSSLISLDPSRAVVPAGAVAAGGTSPRGPVGFGGGEATAQIQAPQLVSPAGPAPAQSLLAVLASYILPGSGPVPAGTLFLLVMLGVLLLAAAAPRLSGSERIFLSGLVGPGNGHELAVRRPG